MLADPAVNSGGCNQLNAMDELITQLTQRVGLTPDQARQAVETVLGFVKGRLPAPIASQLDGMLGGAAGGAAGGPTPTASTDATSDISGIAKGIGGMFGGN